MQNRSKIFGCSKVPVFSSWSVCKRTVNNCVQLKGMEYIELIREDYPFLVPSRMLKIMKGTADPISPFFSSICTCPVYERIKILIHDSSLCYSTHHWRMTNFYYFELNTINSFFESDAFISTWYLSYASVPGTSHVNQYL